ncbi:hypothetical protein CDEST_07981 [Colletotrichum destructivum]|uniref:Uncharacterized protein n=1 Tax=Colletotrichum destructivum TaxID=34406 RepID=A0AAX4II47_9PEZI|nr:hypothetical protein CDEST_07981 [Colletotrichum destructivum]
MTSTTKTEDSETPEVHSAPVGEENKAIDEAPDQGLAIRLGQLIIGALGASADMPASQPHPSMLPPIDDALESGEDLDEEKEKHGEMAKVRDEQDKPAFSSKNVARASKVPGYLKSTEASQRRSIGGNTMRQTLPSNTTRSASESPTKTRAKTPKPGKH